MSSQQCFISYPARDLIIIDPQPLFRNGINGLIIQHDLLRLVGEASDSQHGIELVREKRPHLILLASDMKESNSIETIKTIKLINDSALVILISDSVYGGENLYALLEAGADGCLPRDIEPEELVTRLVEAAPGNIITSRALRLSLQRILTGEVKRSEVVKEVQLTRREEEVLQLLTNGLCNKRIGRELGISDGTVKVYVKGLFKKLQVRNRLEAVCWLKRQSGKQASGL